MTGLRPGAVLCLSLIAAVVTGSAQDPQWRPPDYDYFDARTHRGSQRPPSSAVQAAAFSGTRPSRELRSDVPSPALTSAGSGDPETIARNYLSRQPGPLAPRALSAFDLPLEARYESKAAGLTHLVFQQRHAGIPFFGGHVQVHVDAQGRIGRVHQKALPARPVDLVASLVPKQALEATLLRLAPGTDPDLQVIVPESGAERRTEFATRVLRSPAPVSLIWFPLAGSAVAGWQTYIDVGHSRTYWVVIDANSGSILFSQNLARDADPRGTVFAAPAQAHPNQGAQTGEPFTGWPSTAGDCPADIYPALFRSGALMNRCWVTDTETLGNNADACLDLAGGNGCEARAVSSSLRFDFPFTNSYAQTGDPAPDRAAALTNAFYWANAAHDWLYRLGFDESAGNFQADNFGRGGLGLDPVLIDVHDGSLASGASFTTPADGLSPRMQLGLYSSLRRDSSFDGDVIVHEYVHGLTARLAGGPGDVNGLPLWQSGALAEGWSDAYAASFTNDPVIGEYVTNNPTSGLRTVAYDQSPYTFGRLGTLFLKVVPDTGGLNVAVPQVHRDGEIWASVLWDIRELVGRQDFEMLLTSALMLTPPRPSMLDARDTLLQAAQAMSLGGANACELWAAFAARGFGASAALNPIEPGQEDDTALSVFEAWDVPAVCGGSPPILEMIFDDNVEGGTGGWTASGQWHRTTRRAESGSHSWWFGQEATATYDTGARAFGTLVSSPIDLTGATQALVEWDQLFEGEGFGSQVSLGSGGSGAYLNADSGRLLVSTDDGSSWQAVSAIAHNSPIDTFVHYRVDLTRFSGQTIRLSFAFDTFDNQFNQHEGWYIDNVRVSGLIPGIPTLAVAPPALNFAGTAGGLDPATQLVSIANAGSGALDWTVSVVQGASWLQVSPAAGTGDTNLTVSALASGMPPGVHSGAVEVSAGGANNSPVLIPVTLTVAPPTGPAAAWSFEEATPGSGVTIVDGLGSGHHGTTTSFGAIAVPGVTGNSRLLNGYSDSIEVPFSGTLIPPSFTLRTWVKLQAYPASHFGMIAASYGGNYQGWFLAVNGEGKVVFLGTKAPSFARWLVSASTLALERWYALSVTYHRPTGIAALYIDGSREAQVLLPGLELETSRALTFGRSSWHNGYYLNFAIDETQIYPVAQTPSEVAADLAAFSPPAAVPNPAIAAEWSFDGQAEDMSGNGHNGSLQGTQAVSGVLGSARHLNGLTDAINFGASHRLTPSRFTMRAWVRLSSYPLNFGIIAANYNGNYQGWFVAVNSAGRLIVSQSHRPIASRWTVSNTTLALDRWYHLTVVFDSGMQRVSVYLDGVLDRQDLLVGLTPQDSGVFAVGKSSWHQGYYLAFDVDELRLVPRAFSASEVQSDFASFPAP